MSQLRQKFFAVLSGHYLPGFEPDLAKILASVDPQAPLKQKIDLLEQLIAWVRIPVSPTNAKTNFQQIHSLRVKYVLKLLERDPTSKKLISEVVSAVLLETDPLTLFWQVGLNRQVGFFSEAFDRMQMRILPTPYNEYDLSEVFGRFFNHGQDSEWIRNLDKSTLGSLSEMIAPSSAISEKLQLHFDQSILSALTVLSAQITTTGLSAEVRGWADGKKTTDSPFLKYTNFIFQLQEAYYKQGTQILYSSQLAVSAFELIHECRREIATVFRNLESHGVSVSIVFRLELLEQAIERSEQLLRLLLKSGTRSDLQNWVILLSELIRRKFESQKIRGLVRDNMHLLSRKIVERTGASGEHYITRNWSEYKDLLKSASGGGVVTVFTTVGKIFVTHLSPALFFEGFLLWVNYAGSFLLMQAMHFTLATKQPSMTAPALAAKLKELKSRTQLDAFVDEIMCVTRSQFAAALGNIGVVIPAAIAANFAFNNFFSRNILSPYYAEKVIASLHPLKSLTLPLAALTGVLLWAASIVAGWIENWLVYRRLPESISQNSKIKFIFGDSFGGKVASWLVRNVSGIAGNITLGFLLAFTPVVGRFFGLPLDVRHVTLSACALTLAVCSLGVTGVNISNCIFAGIGIVCIGLLNFGVSFALALYVALRARQIRGRWLGELRSSLFERFARRPLDFILPKS